MTEALHDVRFPGESDEYRAARDELLKTEMEVRRQIEAEAARRRELPLGGEVPEDYEFEEWDEATASPHPVRLSELFADGKDSLFLYSFMFRPAGKGEALEVPCPACTSIVDAAAAEYPHIAHRINFAVVTKAPIARFQAHARARGWQHVRLLSSAANTYNRDYKAEDENEMQKPIANVFVRRDGRIHHWWASELMFAPTEGGMNPRHVDFMWPLWNVLDRMPEGRAGDPEPRLSYS